MGAPHRPLQGLEITLYSAVESGYLSPIIGGFEDLQERGAVALNYAFDASLRLPRHLESYALWAALEGPTIPRTLMYFDLLDDPRIGNEAALRRSDLYFKRGYRTDLLAALPWPLRQKVQRLPLHYAVRGESNSTKTRVRRALEAGDWKGQPIRALRRSVVAGLRETPLGAPLGVERPRRRCAEFVADPGRTLPPKVFFRTRLYDVEAARNEEIAQQLSALNNSRVALIHALREAFGDRAHAGLYSAPGSRRHAPELITHLPAAEGREVDYLSHCRQFLINVNNVGVAGSNGWKIPEILASGVCLVTESLEHEYLEPLREGVEVATFQTPEECIARCQALLDSPEAAQAMREAGHAYFQRVLRPEAAMSRVLANACDAATARSGFASSGD